MHLEELQRQWLSLDRKLDQILVLETEMARQVVMRPARGRVHRLAIWPAIDIVFCVGVVLFIAAYLGDHWRDGRQATLAIVVIIGALGLLASAIRQLDLAAKLDWCGPVAEIQSALERLRVMRIQQFKWTILFAPLVGFCGLLIGLRWLLGDRVRILDQLDSGWIAANLIFGVLFVPLGEFVSRILAQRCRHHPWRRAILDDISGASLKAAAQEVERWASLQSQAAKSDEGAEMS